MELYEKVDMETLINIPYHAKLYLFDEATKKEYTITAPGRATVSVMLRDKRNTVGNLTQQYINTLLAQAKSGNTITGVRVSDHATVTREMYEADETGLEAIKQKVEGKKRDSSMDIDIDLDIDMDMDIDFGKFTGKDLVNAYQDFRQECMKTYTNFVREAWKEYKGEPPMRIPEEKEVPPMILPEDDSEDGEAIVLDQTALNELKGEKTEMGEETNSWFSFLGKIGKKKDKKEKVTKTKEKKVKQEKKSKQLPIDKVVNTAEEKPVTPKAIAPISQVPEATNAIFSFSIFGTTYKVRLGEGNRFKMNGMTENDVANALEILAERKFDNLLYDCLKIRKDNNLSDWAYYQVLQELTNKFCGKGTNEATLLLGYIFSQSGYKIRLGRDDNKLVLLLASQHTIFNELSYRLDGDRFYLLGESIDHLCICRASFPNETGMSLIIPLAQQFTYLQSEERTIKSYRYPDFKVTVHTNNNLLKFYDTYLASSMNDELMTRWAMYANTPLAKDVKDELYPQLKSKLQGLSQLESVRRLLDWVQTGFEYKFDEETWGRDRAFFAEETLHYPFCDCEDRSILLSRLVRDLLGMKAILIYYPGHLAMAVHFDEEVNGDYITLNNERYTVCDPTYIHADVGRTMPNMDNSTARVILLQN